MTLAHRPLGKTGILVSEIGFGTWGIGGSVNGDVAYGPTNDEESRAALRKSAECGVTFYDLSDLYGFGHSEELVGEVFESRRDRLVLATKAGFVMREGKLEQEFSSRHLETSLDASLRRLRTDYIDLFLLHSPPASLILSDPRPLETLSKMKGQGKVRAIGVSARSPEEAVAIVQAMEIDALQVNFNLIDQRAVQIGLFKIAAEKGIGIICRTPLCFGFLGGGYSSQTSFDSTDHRRKWSPAQQERWARAYEEFAPVLQYPGETQNQLALRFCLSYPAVSTVIPGMITPAHVEENVRGGFSGPFPQEVLRRLEEIYGRHEFFLRKGAS